jgi:hypothetical protein
MEGHQARHQGGRQVELGNPDLGEWARQEPGRHGRAQAGDQQATPFPHG